jgi:hypothetical protein
MQWPLIAQLGSNRQENYRRLAMAPDCPAGFKPPRKLQAAQDRTTIKMPSGLAVRRTYVRVAQCVGQEPLGRNRDIITTASA